MSKLVLINLAGLFLTLLFGSSCGVKGVPLPPTEPTELSRGKPTYKRATKNILFKNTDEQEDDKKKKGKKK